ncbi:MAG: AHH domain-containing protein [Chloroflexi bacterium]|nr:AHH domain-containing protein [Chloroflexota bacterium]
MADALEYVLWKETRNCANRRNSSKLRRQLRRDVKEDRYAWEWRAPKPGQHAHHIIPSGDVNAELARKHLESLGIAVNSVLNGVGLRKRVHYLTNTERYVKAVDTAIRTFDNPDDVVQFLDQVARDLSKMNHIASNESLLRAKFEEFLVAIEGLSQ